MKPSAHELFEILAREHAESVFAFLRAAGHSHDQADDLLQESLLVAWRRIDDFDRKRSFGPWLRGIAAKLSMARKRKLAGSKEATLESQVLEHLQHRFDQLDHVTGFAFQEKIEILRVCLNNLSQTDREIVGKKYQGDSTLVEIASALALNLETVKKRIQRARTSLKDCIVGKLNELSTIQS